MRIVDCWIIEQIVTSPKVIASQISSVGVINTFDITHNFEVVAEQVFKIYGMSGTEGQELAGTDPIDLQLPRGAAGSSRMPTTEQSTPQSTAPVTRPIDTKSLLQATQFHGDRASFLGWKWSFSMAVRATSKPLYEKTQEN